MARVGGGALYAPLQGVYADAKNVQLSYWVSWVGFMMSFFFGVGMVVWKRNKNMIYTKWKRNKAEEVEAAHHEVDHKEEKHPDDVTFMGAEQQIGN